MKTIFKVLLPILLSFSLIAHAGQKRTLVLRSPTYAGMFVSFNFVLGALYLYEQGQFSGVKVDFVGQGHYYEEEMGPNWWDYYFEPISVGKVDYNNVAQLTDDEINSIPKIALKQIPKEEAHRLIKKYIKVKPHIQKKVQEFVRTQFGRYYVIGVHYRGNDKYKEIMRTPFMKVDQAISRAIERSKGRNYKFFVATDEESFLKHMREKHGDRVCCINAIRSKDRKPIHFRDSEQYRVGEEAVIDCLLLSRCNILIRTPSSLSATSEQFNPKLPVIRAGNWR